MINKIRYEKLQYDTNREEVKSLDKIDEYEYLSGEKISPSDQSKQVIEQAKFTYSIKDN